MNKKVLVFHPGTQHSWQTATALQQLNRLHLYATSIFYQPERWPYRIERYLPGGLSRRVHGEFLRFTHSGLDPALVRTVGIAEWVERVARRIGYVELGKRIDSYGNRRFAAALRSQIASKDPFALWGYSSSSLDAFRAGKAAGRLCILDRTIGDWRTYNEVMSGVQEVYPEFFPEGEWRVPEMQIERDDEEYSLADVILTGSPFAAETVRVHAADRSAADRIRVLNYCFDETLFASQPPPQVRPRDQPVRFIFLGQAGPRKGIHLVLKTFNRIPRSAATLTIVGDLQVPPSVFAQYADRVDHKPTVARRDVPYFLSAADVLLFPSYFEGSALSLLEGLASGVALIQSGQAGVGVTVNTGLMLPELSEEALYAAVMTAIEDRDRLEAWRAAAYTEASLYSFENYKERIATLVKSTDN